MQLLIRHEPQNTGVIAPWFPWTKNDLMQGIIAILAVLIVTSWVNAFGIGLLLLPLMAFADYFVKLHRLKTGTPAWRAQAASPASQASYHRVMDLARQFGVALEPAAENPPTNGALNDWCKRLDTSFLSQGALGLSPEDTGGTARDCTQETPPA